MVKYGLKDRKENMAKAAMKDIGISPKHAIEVCKFIRGKKSSDAKRMLEEVLTKKQFVPFTRFNHNVGHKKGGFAGRYPIKACHEILKLVKQCESNAQLKGLNTNDLFIRHILSNRASAPWHFGRQSRQKMKRTHLEIILEEKKAAKPEVKKTETVPVEKKPEVKVEEKKTEKPVEKHTEVKPAEEKKKEVVKVPIKKEETAEKKEENVKLPVEKKEEKKTEAPAEKKEAPKPAEPVEKKEEKKEVKPAVEKKEAEPAAEVKEEKPAVKTKEVTK